MGDQAARSRGAVEEEEVLGPIHRLDLPGDQVEIVAPVGDEAAVGADREHPGARAGRLLGGAERPGDQGERPRDTVEEEDVGAGALAVLPGREVAGVANEGEVPPVGAEVGHLRMAHVLRARHLGDRSRGPLVQIHQPAISAEGYEIAVGADRRFVPGARGLGGGPVRVAHQGQGAVQAVVEIELLQVDVPGLAGQQVRRGAQEENLAAVPADGERGGEAGEGGLRVPGPVGGAGGPAQQDRAPGGPVVQEDVPLCVGVALPVHQVGRRAFEDHPAAVGAQRAVGGGAVARLMGGGAGPADERHGAAHPVVEEQVERVGGVDLPGHQVRGGAREEDVAAVGADLEAERRSVPRGVLGAVGVAHQHRGLGHPVAQEDVGPGIRILLILNDVDGLAGEGHPAAVGAEGGEMARAAVRGVGNGAGIGARDQLQGPREAGRIAQKRDQKTCRPPEPLSIHWQTSQYR